MTDTPAPGVEIPLDTVTTPEMLENTPEQVYARLRRTTPIVRLQALGGRIIFTKAEDVTRVKTDTEHFWSSDTTSPMQRAFGGHTLMRKDGCPHLRERRAMMPALTSEQVERWRPAFERLTDVLLEAMASHDTVDLAQAFAVPLSADYLKSVLGLDDAGAARLFDWAGALVRGAMNAGNDPAVFAASDQANAEMNGCYDRMIHQHRASPDGSVLSVMANALDPIKLSQIRTNMKVCIGGAVIETRDALLSTIHGLLSNPDQLRHCIETSDWTLACEEGLRWVAPIQASPRIVKKALMMRGLYIPEGEAVMAVQASANHDVNFGDTPQRFYAHRVAAPHQSFGEGTHACLGGPVYRLLAAQIVLPRLFNRYPAITLTHPDQITFKGFAFRGLVAMHVTL
jgi:cytochrome P450